MKTINNENNIILRPLKNNQEEYLLLERWYQNINVYKYFEQKILTLKEIIAKYKPRTKKDSPIKVYMIIYLGNPIGIVQYQKVKDNKILKFGLENYSHPYEIDIFIGKSALYNKGLGFTALNLMLKLIFKETTAKTIVLSVQTTNIRAIKCYEKVGFKIIKEISGLDTIGNKQQNYLMLFQK